MSRRVVLAVLAGVVLAAAAGAGVWRAADPDGPQTVEARTQQVASTLRCPTCQNLSVADSDSRIARGMRDTIGEQLAAGRSPDEVRGFFVDRYGEWVLLYPERDGFGWVAWLLPVAGLGLAGVAAAAVARRSGGGAGVRGGEAGARRGEAAGDAGSSSRGTLDEGERARVEQALASLADGTLATPATVAGERLESALVLLQTVRADEDTSPAVEVRAERRVVAALDEVPAEAAASAGAAPIGEEDEPVVPVSPSGSQPEPDAASEPRAGRVWWRRRPVVWGTVGALFAAVLAVTLTSGVEPRGAGDVPTGGIPSGSASSEASPSGTSPSGGSPSGASPSPQSGDAATSEDAAEEIARLRDTLADDPDDTRSRLLLAVRLLEGGQPGEAETEAGRVLDADPDHPDGLLVLGLAQASQQDPAATTTLERFVERAPAEHPGIDMANAILERAEARQGGQPGDGGGGR